MSRFFKSAAFPILIVVVLAFFAQRLINQDHGSNPYTYTNFQHDLQVGNVASANIKTKDNTFVVTLRNPPKEQHELGFVPDNGNSLVNELSTARVDFNVQGTKTSGWLSLLTYVLPFLIFIGFWIFLMNQVQGGGSKVMSFGKSRAKRLSVDSPKITFRDVAGVDEAVEELHEIKEFLENPKKFQALGARIPKGVLLYGPPGTGKTLLARAVAGEAGVPFFSISGSDFVEMFVGVGASRVRDLFEQAKQNSPCIIFMDEIDAVGRHRGAGMGGGHDEREQTLNQLLVEMDGFEAKDNIIMIAATNRPDILDPALLRPGRFDRQITVDRPDRKGRAKILEVHTRGKPLAREIDIDALAGQTPGFTGADLANLVNEAALLAARTGKREITQVELEEGIMRVIAGPEKKTRVMSDKERRITAYHEMGHAIVGHYLEHSDPVHKISVISRGQALGYTISLPTEDKFLTTRAELTDTMAMTLGGRAAEEIVFGEITTGASNDLEKVTATAKQMVMRFGMSEKLGPRVFGHEHSQPFLGREFSSEPDYSDEIAREIDDEIRRIVEGAHQSAKDILGTHRESLQTISEILIKRETLEREQFEALLDGQSEEDVFGAEASPPPEVPRPSAPAAMRRVRCRGRVLPVAPPRPEASTSQRSRSWLNRSTVRRCGRAAVVSDHGRAERHAGLVLRRWPLPRCRGGGRARARAGG
jgi:cell division protease FtsH